MRYELKNVYVPSYSTSGSGDGASADLDLQDGDDTSNWPVKWKGFSLDGKADDPMDPGADSFEFRSGQAGETGDSVPQEDFLINFEEIKPSYGPDESDKVFAAEIPPSAFEEAAVLDFALTGDPGV